MVLLILHDFSRGDSDPGVLGVLGIDGILRSQNLPRISAHLSLNEGLGEYVKGIIRNPMAY